MTASVTLVVAMGRNRVIGHDGGMPWHLPADLAHFKSVTMGKPIIMGRRTYESIGRALPGRENVVITRNAAFEAEGCTVVHSLEEALAEREGELMVIGGGQLYREALPLATRIHLTEIDAAPEGDTTFPALGEAWREVSREQRPADDANAHDLTFVELVRDRPLG